MLAMIRNEVQGTVEEKLQTALAELQRNTHEIQESVMSGGNINIVFYDSN